jgi:hypothetical protein
MSNGVVLSLLLLFVVHVVAFVALFAMLGEGFMEFFRGTPHDDDDGGLPPDEPVAPVPGGDGGLPLPDAEQAPVRLREPGRIAERYPRPQRRREHAPQRTPARERELA